MFTGGDHFLLTCHWCNPGFEITLDHYILLDVYDRYWFWPGWTEAADLMTRQIPTGDNTEEVILEFTWPELETPETTGLRFWSAFLKPASSEIIGEVDVIEWGYY